MNEIRFDEQVVLVTGAGRGLGAGYARLLAQRGATVIVHDAGVATDGSGADSEIARSVVAAIVAEGGKAEAAFENLLAPSACEDLIAGVVERHGRIDALIHNAGVVLWEDDGYPTDEIWDQTMGVNATAGFRLIRAVITKMRRRGYGRIVLTISGRATHLDSALPGLVAYSAAKMAVYGLMVGFAAEVAGQNIHLNCVSPVAATRVLVRNAPELTVDSAAPAAVLLASSTIDRSGMVLAAGGGQFRLDSWSTGATTDLGPEPTLEQLNEVVHQTRIDH